MDLAEMFTVADAAAMAGLPNPDDYRPNRKVNVPWRADASPSLFIWSSGLGYCDYSRQGEPDWAGNAIKFLALCLGVTYSQAFQMASGRAAKEKWDTPERQDTKIRKERDAKRDARPDPLQVHQLALLRAAVNCLGKSRCDVINALAKQRGWKVDTIYNLTCDMLLGYVDFAKWFRPLDPDHGQPWPTAGVFGFVYGWGFKARWRNSKGDREIRWLHNYGLTKPTLWNGPAAEGAIRQIAANRVVITEGETDAITLIDAGCKAHVMALPSASYVIAPWELAQLAGKSVTLAIDNDKAGRLCRDRVTEQLKPYCRVGFLPLPEGMDVDEARKAGKLDVP